MSFAAKLIVCLKLASLSLFLEKATHSFQPQAFRGRMTAWSARNDCSWPLRSFILRFQGSLNGGFVVRFQPIDFDQIGRCL